MTNLIKCDEIRNTKLVVDFLNVVDANVYKIKKKVSVFFFKFLGKIITGSGEI